MRLRTALASALSCALAVGLVAASNQTAATEPERAASETQQQNYTWRNVEIAGGGFVPGIIFNQSEPGLVYARTDIGGAYRLNADDSWSALLDFADDARWDFWGVDALATDPADPRRLYLVSAPWRVRRGKWG